MKDYFSGENADRLSKTLREWIGTPYRHYCGIKGRGTDCILFIGNVFVELNIIDRVDYQYYGKDWFLHSSDELLFNYIEKHIKEHLKTGLTAEALDDPVELRYGDLLCFRQNTSKATNHAAFYIGNNEIIHSYVKRGVVTTSIDILINSKITRLYRLKEI